MWRAFRDVKGNLGYVYPYKGLMLSVSFVTGTLSGVDEVCVDCRPLESKDLPRFEIYLPVLAAKHEATMERAKKLAVSMVDAFTA